MRNIVLNIIVILICSACSSIKSQSSNEFLLKPRKDDVSDDVSGRFNVVIKADSMQAVSVDGLKFSLKIYNKSEKTTTTVNPMDSFRLSLINENGFNILYPHTLKIVVHALPGKKFPFEAFNVLKIEVNGKQRKDNLEEIEQIEIPGKSSYEIFLSITKSLKPDASKPYKIEYTERLPKGRYILSMGLTLNKDKNYKGFSGATKINYGYSIKGRT